MGRSRRDGVQADVAAAQGWWRSYSVIPNTDEPRAATDKRVPALEALRGVYIGGE